MTTNVVPYRDLFSFEDRCRESSVIRMRYPERMPVIIEPRNGAPRIDKRKFMAPVSLTFAQLMFVVRKRLPVHSSQGLFFFVNDTTIVESSSTVLDTYASHADKDGFLYVGYALESTFGNTSWAHATTPTGVSTTRKMARP